MLGRVGWRQAAGGHGSLGPLPGVPTPALDPQWKPESRPCGVVLTDSIVKAFTSWETGLGPLSSDISPTQEESCRCPKTWIPSAC